MVSASKALHGIEVGTRAGYLVLFGAVAFVLWKILGPKSVKKTVIPPPVGPVAPTDPAGAPAGSTAGQEDYGILAGGLVSKILARVIDPAKGQRVYRRTLRSVFPATIELVNDGTTIESVTVEAVVDVYEYTGGERLGIRTVLGPFPSAPRQVARYDVELDAGNVDSGVFEFGQGDAVVRVFVNGVQTQSTSFEVW